MRKKVRRRKLATQILASQLTILVFTVLLGFALLTVQERRALDRQYEARAPAIAQTVAGIPNVGKWQSSTPSATRRTLPSPSASVRA